MVMGATAGVILADLGADVIKVEPINGDNTRHLTGSGAGYFPMYNRNKRSIKLDLKCEAGINIAKRLIASADILIENFRTGTMDKLGLGYESMKTHNQELIYCSLKGFLSGPYEDRVALDELVQMMGGLAYMTGLPDRPLRAGSSVIDITGGMFGVIGILAALQERRITGAGKLHTGPFSNRRLQRSYSGRGVCRGVDGGKCSDRSEGSANRSDQAGHDKPACASEAGIICRNLCEG